MRSVKSANRPGEEAVKYCDGNGSRTGENMRIRTFLAIKRQNTWEVLK